MVFINVKARISLFTGLPVAGPAIILVFSRLRRKVNTWGREDTRSGKDDVLTTCFIQFSLTQIFFVPYPPLKHLCSLKISLPAGYEEDYLKKTNFSF